MLNLIALIGGMGLMITIFGAFELMDNEPGALKKIFGGVLVFGIALACATALGYLSILAHIKITS
jgi:hypothetical protein